MHKQEDITYNLFQYSQTLSYNHYQRAIFCPVTFNQNKDLSQHMKIFPKDDI